jgi:hypothetical protein
MQAEEKEGNFQLQKEIWIIRERRDGANESPI